ncbi:prenyltransferase and squalene oxidase [Phlyctema vagabunda]|uniref:Geranylgeranyl transferase type-1 subunit beta n=1 Tax=Phlyctema vagabunda TaxID=108571 RepID=A0ABR4P3J5_9HELO
MEEPKLNIEQHVKYWQRCLKTLLPTQYTSTDSSRMSLAFFILSALDLLSAGAETLPSSSRFNLSNWILSCQHPSGGFCGSPNHKYPNEFYVGAGTEKREMDPANLPATFFALLSLAFVENGRPFARVRRRQTLNWLASLQREDGSFGELIRHGKIEGGKDMRYCYCAAAVRWMLRDDLRKDDVHDIDVEKLVDHIRSGQTYDGGFSESSQHEAHAGYTYCATAALSMLDRLPDLSTATSSKPQKSDEPLPGLTDLPNTIRWLVSRQLESEEEEESDDEVEDSELRKQREALVGIHKDEEPPSLADITLDETQIVGFNGRCNKLADTCYSFWVTASLDILGQGQLVDSGSSRRFLLEQTQHRIGGFGKQPGNPPDIYHSYLGLAALATVKESTLKDFDPVLCISVQARDRIGQTS